MKGEEEKYLKKEEEVTGKMQLGYVVCGRQDWMSLHLYSLFLLRPFGRCKSCWPLHALVSAFPYRNCFFLESDVRV